MIKGLDGSGKSLLIDCVLNRTRLRRGETRNYEINATQGLRFHEFSKFESFWRVWDFSGMGRHRPLWQHYYNHIGTVVFVVDCTDIKRLHSVRLEFQRMMNHPDVLQRKPNILVMVNKVRGK